MVFCVVFWVVFCMVFGEVLVGFWRFLGLKKVFRDLIFEDFQNL